MKAAFLLQPAKGCSAARTRASEEYAVKAFIRTIGDVRLDCIDFALVERFKAARKAQGVRLGRSTMTSPISLVPLATRSSWATCSSAL